MPLTITYDMWPLELATWYNYKHYNYNNGNTHFTYIYAVSGINWFLMGIVGDVEQRPRLIAGQIVDEVLFPEVCIPVYSCPINDNNYKRRR